MRIIGGTLRGIRIQPPGNLPVRPTTDQSKEALFNILNNRVDFESLNVLDLFSGTGNISLEFASRGALRIVSVDLSYHCIRFLTETASNLNLSTIFPVKNDVFKFIGQQDGREKYDLIFADAPFNHPKLTVLPDLLLKKDLLRDDNSLLITEHPSALAFDHVPQWIEQRKYGFSSFSFFKKIKSSMHQL